MRLRGIKHTRVFTVFAQLVLDWGRIFLRGWGRSHSFLISMSDYCLSVRLSVRTLVCFGHFLFVSVFFCCNCFSSHFSDYFVDLKMEAWIAKGRV